MKRLRLAVITGSLLLLVLFLFTGFQALRAKSALVDVSNGLDGMAQSLRRGDLTAAHAELDTARKAATSAHHNTSGPLWWLASKAPGIGDDVTAVRIISEVSDDLSNKVIPKMLDAAEPMLPATLRPKGGRVPMAGIKKVAPAFISADKDFQANVKRVLDIRTAHLSPALAGPITNLKTTLGRASNISQAATAAAQLLPPMMADGTKRKYLLMFQNNAEARATGGIGGSFAEVNVKNGKAKMGAQGSAPVLIGIANKPVLPLTADEKSLFQPEMATYPQDVNFTPDFPRTGQLLAAMWRERHPQPVDGVISADPVALSYLLTGTGPVKMPRGVVLTAANVVPALLNGIYLHYPDDQAAQDSFFQEAAKAVFDAVAAGKGDPGVVLDGLVRSVLEHRLLLWSSHPNEEKLLADSEITGALQTHRTSTPDVGVYLNDGTGAKMDYYLDASTSLQAVSCDNGQQNLKATVTMRSLAPNNAAKLPLSIIGLGTQIPNGVIRTTVLVYAPVGGTFQGLKLDSATAPFGDHTDHGREVAAISLDLAPGQEKTITATILGAPDQSGDPQLRTTPGVRLTGVGSVEPTKCGS
ncbi:MAG: hypothetical protein JWR35_2535 [Marmoricola sp.]|nr:hypothetical protein [Marmoricola sp.]